MMIVWLICLTFFLRNPLECEGQLTEGSKYYKDTPLLMKPYKNADVLGTIAGTVDNVIEFTQSSIEELIFAIKNIKAPNNPFIVNPPQTTYNASELISFLGYPVEEHTVRTSDGYLLGVQRIPKRNGAPVVLFLHGLFLNSRGFVLNYHPYQNLPTFLSDEGFDVWLLNYRGAPNSMKHVSLYEHDSKFWQFSMNELAMIDLPETIDYILGRTESTALSICGHSMGTSTSFALLSTRSDYDSKVKIVVALAPIAKVTFRTSPVTYLYQIANVFEVISALLGTKGKFLPGFDTIDEFTSNACKISIINEVLCQTIAAVLFSLESQNLNVIIRDDQFQGYDFAKNNIMVYNQAEPLPFRVENIGVPVGLISSTIDPLADQKDIEYLRKNLKLIVEDFVINEEYSHFDFIMAENAHTIVHPTVLKLLNQ